MMLAEGQDKTGWIRTAAWQKSWRHFACVIDEMLDWQTFTYFTTQRGEMGDNFFRQNSFLSSWTIVIFFYWAPIVLFYFFDPLWFYLFTYCAGLANIYKSHDKCKWSMKITWFTCYKLANKIKWQLFYMNSESNIYLARPQQN